MRKVMLEQRKIQRVGASTLSVSLPKHWVNLVGVKQGDLITIHEETNGDLRIHANADDEGEPTMFVINSDVVEEPKLLQRLVIASYVRGFDLVKIFSVNRIEGNQLEAVRSATEQLIGLSIMEETPSEIVLQCVLDTRSFKIYSLIRRLATIAATMEDEAFAAILGLNATLAEEVIKRESDANSISRLTTRLLFTALQNPRLAEIIGLEELLDITGVRLVTKNLEGIADSATNLATIAIELQKLHEQDPLNMEEVHKLAPFVQKGRQGLQMALESLFSGNVIVANTVLNFRDELVTILETRKRVAAIPYFRAIVIELTEIAKRSASIALEAIGITIGKAS
jgi:phosphate uptake regulator